MATATFTDAAARNAKPKERSYKVRVARGLYLLVNPDGSKYWRFRYRYLGTPKSISLGVYPYVGVADAQGKAHDARVLLAKGVNPSEAKRQAKLALRLAVSRTFGQAAQQWYEHNLARWQPATAEKVRQYLDKDMLPALGRRPLANITPMELGAVVERIEARKAMNVARKTRQWLQAIFAYAIAKGLTTTNPAEHLGAIAQPAPPPRNRAHISASELPAFLQALDRYQGSLLTRTCTWLLLWTANRPGVTRSLRWDEVDLDSALWTIAKGREGMKLGYAHVTPLPQQAVAALRALQPITGRYPFVFIGRNDPGTPMSDGAIATMLKTMGYGGRQTSHGFRHLVSTALNEMGYEADWIERQLAHGDPDEIRGTYNKAIYLEPRRKMMQAWADHLDSLRQPDLPPGK